MKHAITQLEITLRDLEHNERINRAGNIINTADFYAKYAADVRQALAILKAASNGPIWPEPK